jgi:hypothetical protein
MEAQASALDTSLKLITRGHCMHENESIEEQIISADAGLEQTVESRPPQRASKAKKSCPPAEFLPRARVGKLFTPRDWLFDFGKVYRAVRRGEISTADGSRLAYMASTGKAIAEAVEQLRTHREALEELQRLRAAQAPAFVTPDAGDGGEN